MTPSGAMTEPIHILLWALRAAVTSKADLIVENVALRQQVAVLRGKRPRPRLHDLDRQFWVALLRHWPRWRQALLIVKPETVVRWHRAGFRSFWRWKSRPRRKAGRPLWLLT